MNNINIIVIFSVLLIYSSINFAEIKMPEEVSQFDAADLNDDGKIDAQEFHNRCNEVYFFNDKNMDGMLTKNEIPQDWNKKLIKNVDVNNDENLSMQEFINLSSYVFENADANNDNYIIKNEADALIERQGQHLEHK